MGSEKIAHPPSRLSKLGVKPRWRVSIAGAADADFLRELRPAVATVSSSRPIQRSDAIFLFVSRAADLGRIVRLKPFLTPDGALWIVRPKGDPDITERAVLAAGKEAALVDTKVVAFSASHTAQRFVIPVKHRGRIPRSTVSAR